jgi:hypothetical protein
MARLLDNHLLYRLSIHLPHPNFPVHEAHQRYKKKSVLLCPGDETEVVTRRIVTASRTYWLAGLRDGKGVLRWKTIPCEGKIEALEELDGLLKMKLGKFMRILAKL